MKTFLKIILVIIIIAVVGIGSMAIWMTRGLDAGSKSVIGNVVPTTMEDGIYNGKHNAGRFSNEVNVTVKDHKIIKIDVVKDVTFPKPEWTKDLFNKVIEKQNTDVDVVSGATVTSKAYLKAIENALKNRK